MNVPYYQRKIKCPGHYLIPPNVDIYLREPVPELKGVSDRVVKSHGVQKTRRKKDVFGRPVLDWKKIYALERANIVKQPWITASFAIEYVYDPMSTLCKLCDKRCMEGKQGINTRTIKRLTK